MIQDIKQHLQTTGDFLSITRENEWHLDSFEFSLNNGTLVQVWDTGVINFVPMQANNNDIVISSAVHGNETAPIEICDQLIQDIVLERLTLRQNVLFIFGNPASINIEKRFVEENLNRLFSGAHSDGEGLINKERHRAKALEAYVERFYTKNEGVVDRCHYDLHTAIRGSKNEKFAVYPYLHGKPWHKSQFEFLRSSGVSTVLLMQAPATTFSYFSSNSFGAHSFTIELGQVKPFGQNDMARFKGIDQTLRTFLTGTTPTAESFDESNFELYTVHRTINRENEEFELTFADDVKNFTDYPAGTTLAIDGGNEVKTDVDGEAIIFPNANVAIGQRAILTVIPTQVSGKLI